jgi:hypothetical protein
MSANIVGVTGNAATPDKSKKSLSRYGQFPTSVIDPKGRDSDDEYGPLTSEFNSPHPSNTGEANNKKLMKKTLSKYSKAEPASFGKESVFKKEEDEDFGEIDPSFKPDTVAVTSTGSFVVIPEHTQPKTMKKTLSKYGGPSSAPMIHKSSAKSMDSDDEDYGRLEPVDENTVSNNGQQPMKKSLSKYSPVNSMNNMSKSGEAKVQQSLKDLKLDSTDGDSDEENYGELDPTFKPEKVAVTSTGQLTVIPEKVIHPNKGMKKTLSKYKNTADDLHTTTAPPSAVATSALEKLNSGDESDEEEYGAIESEENSSPTKQQRSPLVAIDRKQVNN